MRTNLTQKMFRNKGQIKRNVRAKRHHRKPSKRNGGKRETSDENKSHMYCVEFVWIPVKKKKKTKPTVKAHFSDSGGNVNTDY